MYFTFEYLNNTRTYTYKGYIAFYVTGDTRTLVLWPGMMAFGRAYLHVSMGLVSA